MAWKSAELVEAAWKQEWEEVEVRSPLEPFLAPSVVRGEPSASGSGQWTLEAFVARRIRPCYAESTLLRRTKPMQF